MIMMQFLGLASLTINVPIIGESKIHKRALVNNFHSFKNSKCQVK